MEKIDTIYEKFITKMSQHDKNYGLSVKFIENQIEEIKLTYDSIDCNTNLYYESSIFYFWDNTQSTFNIYKERDVTIKMLIDDIINHQNIQYQWLLVSAFEDYEKYLKNIYAYLSCVKNKPKELNSIEFINYFDSIYNILIENIDRRNAFDILKVIRENLPKYKSLEINNSTKCDMRFLLLMIQYFRNIIVHNYGKVNDKEKLFKKLISIIGLYGVRAKEYEKIFYYYFPNNTETITLLEIPVFDIIKAETTVLLNLFSVLLNSAYYIKEEVKEKYGA
jgi:hypothetical protein